MDSEHIDRRQSIGASQAPAVCGLSPFSNPLKEYLFFTGAIDGQAASDEMWWGNVMEPVILAATERHFGCKIVKPAPRRHALYPIHASPDGDFGDRRGLEIKNVGRRYAKDWGEPGSDQVPEYVLVQCQQQAEVFGFHTVEVVASIAGAPPAYYSVPRHEKVIALMLGMLVDFWGRVQRRDPPPLDWSDPRTPELVSLLHRPREGVYAALPAEAARTLDAYERLGEEISLLEKARERAKAQLIAGMGEASVGRLEDGRTIKRKLVRVREQTRKAFEFFNFTVSHPKRKDGGS